MPTRTVTTVTIIAAALLAWLAAPAGAEVPDLDMNAPYSATRVIHADGKRIEQRYYQQSAMVSRMETSLEGQDTVMILRGDRNVVWTVMPAQRMYMEISLDAGKQFGAALPEVPSSDALTTVEALGQEVVNGQTASKYRVQVDQGNGTRSEGLLWVAESGVPVRMEFASGAGPVVIEHHDLEPGPQPASLFEAPPGFQRFAPGGVGGMLKGLMGRP